MAEAIYMSGYDDDIFKKLGTNLTDFRDWLEQSLKS